MASPGPYAVQQILVRQDEALAKHVAVSRIALSAAPPAVLCTTAFTGPNSHDWSTSKAVCYDRFFEVQKWALFIKGTKNIICCGLTRSSFITDFFELQFDTTTLIIPSFRMIKARGCKQRFKSDLLRNYLVPGRVYMQYYYTVVSHVPQQQYSRHRRENDNLSTAHQFSCCVHRLKRLRKSPHSPGPQPGTLGAASGADDGVDV